MAPIVPADLLLPEGDASRPRVGRLHCEDGVAADNVEGSRTMFPEERPVITLTDNASSKVRELITAEGDEALALRVAVRPGGCSGYSYEMYFDGDVAGDDVTAVFSGVKVVVDPSSALLLEGATLDYTDGLQGAGFAIDNPNAERTCGCGNSFS
jgi:iron-sulfur cluster assembly protein/iron-sulfur cluster insertion protein